MNGLDASQGCRLRLSSLAISVAWVVLFASKAVAQPQPDTSLFRSLTLKERQDQDRIVARTGPRGLQDGRVPPRNVGTETSYLGMSDEQLWKHLLQSRQIAVVGIKNKSARRGYFAGRRLVSDEALKTAKTNLLRVAGVSNAVVETPKDLQLPSMADGRPYPAVIVKLERGALS